MDKKAVRQVLLSVGFLAASVYTALCFFLYYSQENLIFQALPLSKDFKYSFSIPYEEHLVPTEDGGEIAVVEFERSRQCKEERGSLIFFHGNSSTVESFALRPPAFTERCWKTYFVDYRPYGKSSGSISPESTLLDSRAAFHFVRQRSDKPIVLFGHSLGTGIVAQIASEVQPLAVILEAPFKSVLDIAKTRYPYFPVEELLKYPYRSDLALKNTPFKKLIIHGTEDFIVPYSHGQALALEIGATLYTVKGANHINLGSTLQFQEMLDTVLGTRVTV